MRIRRAALCVGDAAAGYTRRPEQGGRSISPLKCSSSVERGETEAAMPEQPQFI